MYHGSDETAKPPTTKGEPCRLTNSCTPIDLYFTYMRPAPELERGGPRAYVRAVTGHVFSLPVKQLTTDAPIECFNIEDIQGYRVMHELFVTRTRTIKSLGAGGKKRRETAKERDERLARWEEILS